MTTPQGAPQPVQIPGNFPIPSVAPVYIDGVPAVEIGTPSARTSPSQDFWSTQPRAVSDITTEQLTVTLGQQRLVNYIALDLPHFPHVATFCYWTGSSWQPVVSGNGSPLVIITSGSVPAVVDNPAALQARMNPYHYGAGHWVHHDEQVQPFTSSKLMVLLARPGILRPGTQVPVNPAGKPVPYPLGVRRLDFGARALSSSDIPQQPRSPATLSMRAPWTATVDVNGSPVQVATRENRAGDMLGGGIWRSGPMPHAHSVTSLYLDSRDGNGNPQLIERFYIAPITSGVRFNLYYSPVPPPAGTQFAAIDDPLLPGLISPGGTQLPVATPQGIVFPGAPGWLTLSNQAAGTVAGSPWWAGIEIMPGFSSSDPGTYIIADAGILQLSYSNGTWQATMPGPDDPAVPSVPSGGVVGEWSFSFSQGDRLQFIAGHDGQNFFAWNPLGALFSSPVVPPVPPAPVFRFGGLQDTDDSLPVLPGNYTLTDFILKQEQVDLTVVGQGGIPPEFTAFAADPAGFTWPPTAATASTTTNAVARFNPGLIAGSINPWGFAGGLGEAYEACPWLPIRRSYKLARGYVEFDPVLAAAFKFEFTSLQPEPYDYLKPPRVVSKYFPGKTVTATVSPAADAEIDAGLSVGQAIAPAITFNDAPPPVPGATPGATLPTEALYAPDPSAAAQMAAQGGSLYNWHPWQPEHIIPVTAQQGPSSYQEQVITVASRVAYFAAISQILMFRLDYTAADDTAQYLDIFADTHNIDTTTLTPGGWSLQPGTGLAAAAGLAPGGSSAQSLVFNSAHAVTGVQFATVQSDPVQLLDDADFSDSGFANWGPAGDALPLSPSPNSAQLGIMAQVSRGSGSAQLDTPSAPSSWGWLESYYGTWAALNAAVPAWYDFTQRPASSAMGGIAYTGVPVATTAAGRLFAAARVFAPSALSAPLYLQLLDGATGTVIAEAEQAVPAGTITEWFAGYTLGTGLVSTTPWSGVESGYASWSAIEAALTTWAQIDTTVTPLGATVIAQLIQKQSTNDTWDVDNISIFEDAIVWSFSNDGGSTWYPAYDVRNNPRGVVAFPPAQSGQGTQLKWQVAAYRPGLTVSGLAIRPWYVTWPHGVLPRPAGVGHGPAVSPLDQYPAIENDPRWQLSSSPVPDSWFFAVRQALGIVPPPPDFPGPLPQAPQITLGSALVWEPPAVVAAGPQTYTDVYTDTYTDEYAPADGGDVYTDVYCDIYGINNPATTGQVQSAVAHFSAAGFFTPTAVTIPFPAFGAGADFSAVSASDPAVQAWLKAGLPLPARRVAMGNSWPSTLAASNVAGDAGVRRVLIDIRPDSTTTPAMLDTFLASCQAGGLQASVSIWSAPDATFSSPQDWLSLLALYVPVIHRNGYQHVIAVGNNAIAANWLAAWYPGDDLVDVIAPVFGCAGAAPGSGSPTLAVAQAFADAHGKPFGLADWGADHTRFSSAQITAFIAYVQGLFAARLKARKPCYDLFWTNTGNIGMLTAPAAVIAAYKAMAQAI